MKNIIKLWVMLLATGLFASCEKKIAEVTVEGATPPVLTSSVKDTIRLSFVGAEQRTITFSWTNPEYRFSTGPNSQGVNYQVEIDTTGANFTNPKRKVIVVSNDLSLTMTHALFNDYLLNQLELDTIRNHKVEIRLRSTIGSTALPLYSEVLKFVVKPYGIPPKVEAPTNGTLWMTGDAAPSGWSNPLGSPHDVTQKFTKVSDFIYELTVALPGGGNYKLIQEQGNWGSQYHMLTGGTWEGGDFEKRDADPGFAGPPSSGNYKITVDFQRGKFTVTKL